MAREDEYAHVTLSNSTNGEVGAMCGVEKKARCVADCVYIAGKYTRCVNDAMSGCPRCDGESRLMYVWDCVQCVRDRGGTVDIVRCDEVDRVDSRACPDDENSDDSPGYNLRERYVSNMWCDTQRGEKIALEVENDVPACANRAEQDGINGGSKWIDNELNAMLQYIGTLHGIGARGDPQPPVF